MPKIKNYTPLSIIEQDMKAQTEELYDKIPSDTPPAPTEEKVTSEDENNEASKPGRKKGVCKIPRKAGKLIFFEDRHNKAVEDIHWQCKVDRQDVVRTALNEFIKNYLVDDEITPEGAELIRQYYNDTHY